MCIRDSAKTSSKASSVVIVVVEFRADVSSADSTASGSAAHGSRCGSSADGDLVSTRTRCARCGCTESCAGCSCFAANASSSTGDLATHIASSTSHLATHIAGSTGDLAECVLTARSRKTCCSSNTGYSGRSGSFRSTGHTGLTAHVHIAINTAHAQIASSTRDLVSHISSSTSHLVAHIASARGSKTGCSGNTSRSCSSSSFRATGPVSYTHLTLPTNREV